MKDFMITCLLVVLLSACLLAVAQLQRYQRVDQCQHQGFTRTQCWQLEKNGYGK